MSEARPELRVLIVEDDADDAELVILQLERAGFAPDWRRVSSAGDLRSALAKAVWDVVVSDYGMHQLDAIQALGLVHEVAPDLPFIVVSGNIGEEKAVLAMKAGAHDFFLKDRLDRLGKAVEREVREARVRAERRVTLERLRESEELFKALVNQATVGIAHADTTGRFTVVNQRFADIVGRPIPELLMLRESDVTHREDRGAIVPLAEANSRDGAQTYVVDKRYVRPDGSLVWANVSVSVLSHASRRQSGMLLVADDVTDRRRSERERERLLSDLAQTVRVSEMFAGVLGHDLRNPLMTVTMGATLLFRQCEERGVQEMTDIVRRILRSSERMRRMIDQLLDFTRIRMGKGIPLAPQRVDLLEVAQQVIDEVVAASNGEHVRLEPQGNCVGDWDRDRLLQLVSNLVANAVHHREPGSDVVVRIDGCADAGVSLEVHNRGVIPEAILPTIFEPLQTTKAASRDRASGLGLGLFITRQIARAHGGSIRVDSDAENGTRFVVELPRVASELGSKRQPSSFDLAVTPMPQPKPRSTDAG